MSNLELEQFWNFIYRPKSIVSLNYKFKQNEIQSFSKNYFVDNFNDFVSFITKFKDKDCYSTYNPLKEKTTRQFTNLYSIQLLGLDIEYKHKIKPESVERLKLLIDVIKLEIIDKYSIKHYLMTMSGNGVHLFINLGTPIDVNEKTKQAYRSMILEIEKNVNEQCFNNYGFMISMSDRVDINGILRIPETMNTKCGRTVKIIDSKDEGKNIVIRKMFMRFKRMKIKKNEVINNTNFSQKLIPKSTDELMEHPVVKMFFDSTLKESTGWHHAPGFLLQAIIKFSNLSYDEDIQQLERDINTTWGMSMKLNRCSTDNIEGPCRATIKWCYKNGGNYVKYGDELMRLLKNE